MSELGVSSSSLLIEVKVEVGSAVCCVVSACISFVEVGEGDMMNDLGSQGVYC